MSLPLSTNVGKIMPVPVTLLPPPPPRAAPPLFEMAKKRHKKSPPPPPRPAPPPPPSSPGSPPPSIDKKWFVALNVRGCGVKWWGQPGSRSFAGARAAGGPVVLKRVCGLQMQVRERGVVNARYARAGRPRVMLRQRGKDVECSSGEIRTIEFLSECRCLIWFKNSRLGLLYEKVQGEPDPI